MTPSLNVTAILRFMLDLGRFHTSLVVLRWLTLTFRGCKQN
jgi:hypothetical protein